MAKIKVHELAKELDIQSKDVLTFLQSKGIEAKAAQSSLEDADADMVRKGLGKKAEAPKAEAPKAEAPKAEAPKAEAPKAEAPKAAAPKKKTIIFVSNPQNSMNGGRPQRQGGNGGNGNGGQRGGYNGGNGQGGYGNRDNRGNGYNNGNGYGNRNQTAPARTPIKPLTPPSPTPSVQMVSSHPQPAAKKPQAEEVNTQAKAAPVAEAPAQAAPVNTAPANSAPVAETAAAAPVNAAPATEAPAQRAPQGDRPQGGYNRDNRGDRPQGNREGGYRNQGDRPQGNREGGYGSRDNRGNGQGGYGNRDNRGNGQGGYGNRDNRGNGQGGYGNRDNRGDRPQGDRPQGGYNRGGQGDRPQGGYGQGGYGNRDNRGDRPQGGYNRGGQGDRPQGGMGGRPYRSNENGQQGGRGTGYGQGGSGNYAGGARGGRGAGNQGGSYGSRPAAKSFGDEAPAKDTGSKKREERRGISKEKDKREKNGFMYEDGDANSKNKPGRFIKPEKKVEVVEETIKVITVPETITIKDLADKMKIQPSAIVKKLFMEGKIVTVNQEISFEDAEAIAIEYDIICEAEVKVDVIEELLKEDDENEEDMVTRPPVICVMGHVDHGKTSLLDAIRKTNVTDKEAGGITQAIGAYTVSLDDRKITFLDTPGHEAFTAMRMRGANSTDIAILVVAADDGVMPQTVEAINHAKAAGIEIIVAINKIDKPGANIERVKQELTEYELIAEDWGGSTVFVPVSAKTGEGIDTLLEMILLTADVMELKANPKRHARGLVIEAELDKGRGPVATVLVQKGTLHVGDFISAGAAHGKVRAMIDDKGRRVKEATPSTPVEILGLNDVPNAGEVFIAHDSDKTAKSYADTYLAQNKEKKLEETKGKMSLDDLFSQIKEGNLKELKLIVKADVQGSVEAVKQSLLKLSNEEVVVKCIHGGVGAINESDVTLASASNAIIIGFNVRPDAQAKATAEREGVDVRLYRVIYQAIEDIEAAMKGMLDPVFVEKVIGHAEVRQIFKASAIGNIAGSYVLDGEFRRGCKVRITRQGEQVFEGSLASLKRFKDDVKEVKAGYECGLVFDGYDKMQELDIVEAYVMEEVPR